MENTKRIEWIDVLRFIGMFSIYLSHLGEQAGYFFPFGYRYQTPLFFFVAGAMENLARANPSFIQQFKKRFKGIMFPYFFFGVVSLLLIFLEGNAKNGLLLETALQYVLGIRNQLFAPMLWFLPCIFVMGMVFYLFKKLVKNRWIILLIGIVLMVISETLMPHRPFLQPSWFWNIDSVLYYFFYYALGYAIFPYIQKLISSRSVWARGAFIASAAFVTFYAASFLVGKDLVAVLFRHVPNSGSIIHVTGALLLIWFSIALAQVLSSITLFQRIGRNTLWLCGSEQIIRHLTPPLFAILGWNLSFSSPASAIIFTFAAILAAEFGIIPVLKTLFQALLKQVVPTLSGAADR